MIPGMSFRTSQIAANTPSPSYTICLSVCTELIETPSTEPSSFSLLPSMQSIAASGIYSWIGVCLTLSQRIHGSETRWLIRRRDTTTSPFPSMSYFASTGSSTLFSHSTLATHQSYPFAWLCLRSSAEQSGSYSELRTNTART